MFAGEKQALRVCRWPWQGLRSDLCLSDACDLVISLMNHPPSPVFLQVRLRGDGMGDGLHFMGTTLRMLSHTETLTITSYVCVHVCKYIYKITPPLIVCVCMYTQKIRHGKGTIILSGRPVLFF